MSRRFQKQYADQKGAIQEIPGIGIIEAAGAGAPTGGLAGYAKGCNYLDYTNGANYVNAGDSTSATWVRVLSAGGGTGVKIVGGVASVTGTGTVVTGLATVIAVDATLQDDAALTGNIVTATIGDQAGTPAAGSVILKVWKPTGAADCTPIAATAAKSVNWLAWGT